MMMMVMRMMVITMMMVMMAMMLPSVEAIKFPVGQ